MFVSTSDGSAVAIEPMGGSARVSGSGWQLANVDPLDVPATAGSDVSFFYEGSDVITKVYAVGIDASGSAVSIGSGVGPFDNPARLTEIVQYRIDLAPIGSNQVTVWGQPACLRVGSDFMVDDLANDPDCDSFRTNDPSQECVPDVYLGERGPRLREASCTLPIPTIVGNSQVCALGGPSCQDGQGPGSGCEAPTSYCTPDSACGYSFDALGDVAAAGLFGGSNSAITVLRCTFDGTVGSDGSYTPCTGSDGNAVAVVSGNFQGAAATCHSPVLETPSSGWGKTVELGAGSGSAAGVSLEVDLGDPCKLTFTLKPDSDSSFMLPPAVDVDGNHELGALLAGEVELPVNTGAGSAGTARGFAVPLVIRLQQADCSSSTAGTCNIVSAQPGLSAGGLDFNADHSLETCIGLGRFPADTPPPGAR